MKGALQIANELHKRQQPISIVGVPKTIDNDIPYVYKSFGFDTAVEQAETILINAHEEARSHHNGIGLVKLMGRDAGFIAAHASLSAGHVNSCLLPEIPVTLEGETGLFAKLHKRFKKAGHSLIVVAEGVAQQFASTNQKRSFWQSHPS